MFKSAPWFCSDASRDPFLQSTKFAIALFVKNAAPKAIHNNEDRPKEQWCSGVIEFLRYELLICSIINFFVRDKEWDLSAI